MTKVAGTPPHASAVPPDSSDGLFERFFYLSLDLLATTSIRDGRWKRVNPSFTRVLGWSEQELLATPFFDLIHPEDLPQSLVATAELSTGEALDHFENRIRCKDGTYRWIAWATWYDRREDLIYCSGRDITAQKQAEEALRKSDEQLRMAAAAGRMGAYSRDLQTGENYWSEEFLAIFGLSPQDSLPLTEGIPAAVHPEDRARVLAEAQARLRSAIDPEFDSEHRIVLPSGETRWVQVRGRVTFDQDGQPITVTGFIMDVTQRKYLDMSLARDRELLHAIMDTIPAMLVLYDPDLEGFQLSRECERVVGWTTEETRHIDLLRSIYPNPEYRHEVEEFMTSLAPGWRDFIIVAKDGSRIETSWANVRLSDHRRMGIGLDVSERRRAERALKESHDFTRLVLNNLYAFVGVLKLDGMLLEANRAPLESAGITIDDVRGRKFWDCYWWNYSAEVQKRVRSACHRAAHGEVVRFDIPVRMAGDSRIMIDFQIAPLRDAKGRITHLIPSAVDITERKRAEEALRESDERLRAVLDHLPVGIWFADADGVLRYANPAGQRIWCGAKLVGPDEFYEYKGWWEETGEPVAPEDWAVVRAIRDGETSLDEPIRIQCFDGTQKIILNSAVPIHGADGKIIGAAILNEDITARAEAEKILRDSELFHRQTLESIPGMVFTTRPDGYCDYQSRQWAEFTGVPMEQHLGDGWNQLLHPDDRPRALAAWRAAVAEQAPYDLEYRVRRYDGEYQWFAVRGRPIRNADGHIVRWFGVAANVDALKRTQEALSEARDDLEKRVQERTAELQQRADQLARMTSEVTLAEQRERRRLAQVLHDHLQQLLVGAKFGLALLGRRAAPDQSEAVTQIEGLISEAIHASRSLTVELSPPILHEAGLGAALNWLARWMREKHGLEVELSTDPDATTDREDVRVLVFQAVRELLFNVVKHAGVTSAYVTLTVASGRLDYLHLTVRDYGRGFDAIKMTTDTATAGAGFGLASIQERLALLGGALEIESAAGHGATFTILAPMRAAHAITEARSRDRIDATRPAGHIPHVRPSASPATIRLLLADDHPVMRQGLRALLAGEPDFEVIAEACDGVEAIDLARALHPDVVLMDFSMPRMDGVEATRRIRDELPHVQVIGLSMYDEADRAVAMTEAGAASYLSKSGEANLIIETIRAVARAAYAGEE